MSNRITRRRGMSRICWEITQRVILVVQNLTRLIAFAPHLMGTPCEIQPSM